MKEKAVKLVKYTSKVIFVLAFAITVGLAWLSFYFDTQAASDSSVWNVSTVSNKQVYYLQLSAYTSSYTASTIQVEKKDSTLISVYDVSECTGQLTVSYDPFTFNVRASLSRAVTPLEDVTPSAGVYYNFAPYLYDNLGNRYLLDATNGGSFVIEDTSNITSLSLYVLGGCSGTLKYNPTTTQFKYIRAFVSVSAFDITLSTSEPARTITDSYGTVWTVPDGVENPVVVGTAGAFKFLFDASDLSYITGSLGQLVPVSQNIKTVSLYEPDGSLYQNFNLDILNQNYTVPFYATAFSFDEFFYGSLPELVLEEKPVPDPEPEPDERFEHLDIVRSEVDSDDDSDGWIVIWDASENQPQRDFYGVMHEPRDNWKFQSSVMSAIADDSKDDHYYAHWDEYISSEMFLFLGPSAPYDGYCVISFPKGCYFVKSDNPKFTVGSEYILSDSYRFEVFPYLYVQGVRYELSAAGCQISFPVYADQPCDFAIGYEAHLTANVTTSIAGSAQWFFSYDIPAYDIAIWYYTDNNELSQIVEDLEHFPGADKMDEDKSNLDNAIGDYNEVSDSLFESAGEGLGNFDITASFDFGGHTLSAIAFLSTIMSGIILAMGDYSMLYTVGACLVLVCILLGLFKYFGGDD